MSEGTDPTGLEIRLAGAVLVAGGSQSLGGNARHILAINPDTHLLAVPPTRLSDPSARTCRTARMRSDPNHAPDSPRSPRSPTRAPRVARHLLAATLLGLAAALLPLLRAPAEAASAVAPVAGKSRPASPAKPRIDPHAAVRNPDDQATAVSGSGESPTTASQDWDAIVSPLGQLFPALILATRDATPGDPDDSLIGDSRGLVGASVSARRDGEQVDLTVDLGDLAPPVSFHAELDHAGRRYELHPAVHWNDDALRRAEESSEHRARFGLARDGGQMEWKEVTVTLRPLREAPYYLVDGHQRTALHWVFAAYVDEEHPLVATILDEAKRGGIVGKFDGYASGDPAQVYRQVFALWRTLQRRGIKYSPLTRNHDVAGKVYTQYVRFIDESWKNGEANCVDGTVLFASLLQKIGLHPSLVLLPGHMLLAFDLDADGNDRAYLETIRIGTANRGRKGRGLGGLDAALDDEVQKSASLAGFEAAIEEGLLEHANAVSQRARSDGQFQIIPIAAARERGIRPIGISGRGAPATPQFGGGAQVLQGRGTSGNSHR